MKTIPVLSLVLVLTILAKAMGERRLKVNSDETVEIVVRARVNAKGKNEPKKNAPSKGFGSRAPSGVSENEKFPRHRSAGVDIAPSDSATDVCHDSYGKTTSKVKSHLFHRTENTKQTNNTVKTQKSKNANKTQQSKKKTTSSETTGGRFDIPLLQFTLAPVASDPTIAPKLLGPVWTTPPKTRYPILRHIPRYFPRHRKYHIDSQDATANETQVYQTTRTRNFPMIDSPTTVQFRPLRSFNSGETKRSKREFSGGLIRRPERIVTKRYSKPPTRAPLRLEQLTRYPRFRMNQYHASVVFKSTMPPYLLKPSITIAPRDSRISAFPRHRFYRNQRDVNCQGKSLFVKSDNNGLVPSLFTTPSLTIPPFPSTTAPVFVDQVEEKLSSTVPLAVVEEDIDAITKI